MILAPLVEARRVAVKEPGQEQLAHRARRLHALHAVDLVEVPDHLVHEGRVHGGLAGQAGGDVGGLGGLWAVHSDISIVRGRMKSYHPL